MSTLLVVLSILVAVIGVFLTVIILLQSDRAGGLGAISAANSSTYWQKNKGSSMEGALERYTKIGGAAFLILALISNFVH